MRTRRGIVLMLVLVCLAVAAVLIAVTVRRAVVGHRGVQTAGQDLQAAWLAESGLERAYARLAADSQYAGETWNVPAAELDGRHAAKVVVTVRPVADRPRRRIVRVQADFPDDSHFRCRRSKEVLMDI